MSFVYNAWILHVKLIIDNVIGDYRYGHPGRELGPVVAVPDRQSRAAVGFCFVERKRHVVGAKYVRHVSPGRYDQRPTNTEASCSLLFRERQTGVVFRIVDNIGAFLFNNGYQCTETEKDD